MDTARKITFHGHHYNTSAVIEILTKEIAHFQSRVDMLSGSALDGSDYLLQTYTNMVTTREKIRTELGKTLAR
jgi:hypothetical protein